MRFRFTDKDQHGFVEFQGKYEEKYYKKYGMDTWNYNYGCAPSVCVTKFRYINWSDITGFIRSRRFELSTLGHKIKEEYHIPRGFDHTTYWCKAGEKWPLFCLTEPYPKITDDEKENFECLAERHGLKYKIYDPSEKSLWYPKSTYMIFWWNPKYFDFEENQKLIFSHEDATEFEKKCKITLKNK